MPSALTRESNQVAVVLIVMALLVMLCVKTQRLVR